MATHKHLEKKKKHNSQLKVNYKHDTFIELIFFLIQLQKQDFFSN